MPKEIEAVQSRAAKVGDQVYRVVPPYPEEHVAHETIKVTFEKGSVVQFPDETVLEIPKGTCLLKPKIGTLPKSALLDVREGESLAFLPTVPRKKEVH